MEDRIHYVVEKLFCSEFFQLQASWLTMQDNSTSTDNQRREGKAKKRLKGQPSRPKTPRTFLALPGP